MQAFIRENLPLAPVPHLPGICLHLAHEASGLWRLAERDSEGFDTPYWAYRWAGGLALAHFLIDRPDQVAGLDVLDLGAGSGIVGIAAARAGARAVTAAETDGYALAALALNAEANNVILSILNRDLTSEPPPPVDLILVGDLFYADHLAARVTAFLERCLAAGIAVLIGDPRRAFLPHSRLRLLAEYPVLETRPEPIPSYVYAFESAAHPTDARPRHSRDEAQSRKLRG